MIHNGPRGNKTVPTIQATIECGFTLERVRDMTRTYRQYVLLHLMSRAGKITFSGTRSLCP